MSTSVVVDVSNESEFNQYLQVSLEKALLIDFYADWCGPCKMIAPQIHNLAQQYPNIQFLKINVDKLPNLSQKYGITAMPTFVFIKSKQEIHRIQGGDINAIVSQLNTMNASIESVEQYKQKGNELYLQNKDYRNALQSYQTALSMLQSMNNYLSTHKDLYIKLHCNIALMYLRLQGNENYNHCIRHCNEVLKKGIDPFNQKAFLRKGEAFMAMQQYQSAKTVYATYMRYDPDNKEMKSQYAAAKSKCSKDL